MCTAQSAHLVVPAGEQGAAFSRCCQRSSTSCHCLTDHKRESSHRVVRPDVRRSVPGEQAGAGTGRLGSMTSKEGEIFQTNQKEMENVSEHVGEADQGSGNMLVQKSEKLQGTILEYSKNLGIDPLRFLSLVCYCC